MCGLLFPPLGRVARATTAALLRTVASRTAARDAVVLRSNSSCADGSRGYSSGSDNSASSSSPSSSSSLSYGAGAALLAAGLLGGYFLGREDLRLRLLSRPQ